MKTAVMKTTQPTAIQPITRPILPRWKGPGWNCLLLRRRMAMGMASECAGRARSALCSQEKQAYPRSIHVTGRSIPVATLQLLLAFNGLQDG